jgi:hypothetical protein
MKHFNKAYCKIRIEIYRYWIKISDFNFHIDPVHYLNHFHFSKAFPVQYINQRNRHFCWFFFALKTNNQAQIQWQRKI